MASQIVNAAKSELLFPDWTEVKNMLASDSIVYSISADAEYKNENQDKQEDDDDEIEEEMAEGGGMEETEYHCDICWYHYASSQKTLNFHKREKYNTHPFLCEWPGCRTIMPDQEALDAHYRYIHERKTYFCPIRTCHQRFVIEAELHNHVAAQHSQDPDVEDVIPHILPSQYRLFDIEEMRRMRETAMARWRVTCGSEDEEHRQIGQLYHEYYSPTARKYFNKRGLLGQDFKTGTDRCRTIDRIFNASNTGDCRPKERYCVRKNGENGFSRSYVVWVQLLHQNEGYELDKFIDNLVLGGA